MEIKTRLQGNITAVDYMDVASPEEGHYNITVVARSFEGHSLLNRHRLI